MKKIFITCLVVLMVAFAGNALADMSFVTGSTTHINHDYDSSYGDYAVTDGISSSEFKAGAIGFGGTMVTGNAAAYASDYKANAFAIDTPDLSIAGARNSVSSNAEATADGYIGCAKVKVSVSGEVTQQNLAQEFDPHAFSVAGNSNSASYRGVEYDAGCIGCGPDAQADIQGGASVYGLSTVYASDNYNHTNSNAFALTMNKGTSYVDANPGLPDTQVNDIKGSGGFELGTLAHRHDGVANAYASGSFSYDTVTNYDNSAGGLSTGWSNSHVTPGSSHASATSISKSWE